MEFHISRKSRDKFGFDQSIYSLNGNVILGSLAAARELAQKMNDQLSGEERKARGFRASHIYAMGLLDEILHLVIRHYQKTISSKIFSKSISMLEKELTSPILDQTLFKFCQEFPPLDVYQKKSTIEEYLQQKNGGISHREDTLEEMLLLWVENQNPATRNYIELFDDTALKSNSEYLNVIQTLIQYFRQQPLIKPLNLSLIDFILLPIRKHPESLEAQLHFILDNWSDILGSWRIRLLRTLDFIQEETQIRGGGPGPIVSAPLINQQIPEMEAGINYSTDPLWMNDLVLIAKNTYVWLDQLSKQFHRPISRLDQIPDEALNHMHDSGITGLWLIGLWERSRASETIKKICGNPEAAASAYSIYDYQIAADLGGETALLELKNRAWQRGIRLASDMVPNHYGIDSPWLVQHPEWFVQVPASPYPAYRFTGPNLSADSRAGIFIEDHYFDRTDAAVVFKYVDHATGQERYIYHGNDGTNMPWNDTAQLDYLKLEVREHIIRTILHVAQLFPIIRFDAAMTLVKKQIQRLWYPEPGTGGAIPSRSEHGLTREEFNHLMPVEFWREVVERARAEQPDTLLLAEAFWMMEDYFVRSLGMHRVYNSAFMNMLRDEKNAEYRIIIKNILKTDPQILKRFVNFMNNPDERTAAEQFGKGDKYFGVCTLMATLPGLPMLGHGQIEGYLEKYGMEYRRSYLNENPDSEIQDRHRRDIFPLLQQRRFFSNVEHFLLYDFFLPEGYVDENVFAYTNISDNNRSLVIYNNQYARTRGWIKFSTPMIRSNQNGARQISIVDGLDLRSGDDFYGIFKDARTGLETIYNLADLSTRGMYFELNGYQNLVFYPIREVVNDEAHPYRLICSMLNGRAVPSIDEMVIEYSPKSIRELFKQTLEAGIKLNWSSILSGETESSDLGPFKDSFLRFSRQVFHTDEQAAVQSANRLDVSIRTLSNMDSLAQIFPLPEAETYPAALSSLHRLSLDASCLQILVPAWLCLICVENRNPAKEGLSSLPLPEVEKEVWAIGEKIGLGVTDQTRVRALLRGTLKLPRFTTPLRSSSTIREVVQEIIQEYPEMLVGAQRKKILQQYSTEIWGWIGLTTALTTAVRPETTASIFIETVLKFYDLALTQEDSVPATRNRKNTHQQPEDRA